VSLTPVPLVKTFAYDPIGNMLTKSDVGNYLYPAAGAALPHAVSSISGGAISTTFTYDLNGNQTGGLGRSISYTSYNKPASITQGTRALFFSDDPDHQRFKQVSPEGVTLYLGRTFLSVSRLAVCRSEATGSLQGYTGTEGGQSADARRSLGRPGRLSVPS
jgi:hypothetical protein